MDSRHLNSNFQLLSTLFVHVFAFNISHYVCDEVKKQLLATFIKTLHRVLHNNVFKEFMGHEELIGMWQDEMFAHLLIC